MYCPKCGSHHVSVYPVTHTTTRYRGCFGWALWILLAILTCGLILIIPLITNSRTKSKTRTHGFCMHCGKSWKA